MPWTITGSLGSVTTPSWPVRTSMTGSSSGIAGVTSGDIEVEIPLLRLITDRRAGRDPGWNSTARLPRRHPEGDGRARDQCGSPAFGQGEDPGGHLGHRPAGQCPAGL